MVFESLANEHVSALNPVTWPSPSVCNGDDLDMSDVHAIDDEEREAAQQKASGVADVRRRGFRSLSDELYDSAASGWTSTANGGISARRVGGELGGDDDIHGQVDDVAVVLE